MSEPGMGVSSAARTRPKGLTFLSRYDDPAMSTVIDMSKAVVLLERFPALAGATATVGAGEIVLLRGPNGVGKTTFLRSCAGLLPVASGRLNVLGHDLVAARRAVRRHVALLGHTSQLYDDLTVVDNVQFWSRASGVRDGDLMGALDRMGVSKRLHSVPVERLSAGQKRRVAIAIVIASRPRLWLLDEPHAGLDQSGRGLLDSLLVDAAEAGATVVFASHELDRAEAVATRSLSFSGCLIVSDDE